MARRRRTSPAEDLMDAVAMLPWWAGVALAAVSYLVLHRMAGQEVVVAVKPGEMGTMVTQTLWKTLATFGQYLLPLICVAGALSHRAGKGSQAVECLKSSKCELSDNQQTPSKDWYL